MSDEFELLKPIVQGGTTAGILVSVGYFVLNRVFALLEQARASQERMIAAFQEEAKAERASHWSEVDKIGDSVDRLTAATTELVHEVRSVKEKVAS